MKHEVTSQKAPKAVGPYSQAIRTGTMVLCSGQIGIDPKTGAMVEGGIKEQVTQIIQNIKAVLEETGCTLNNVVKTTVFLQDMNDFAAMNEVYGDAFAKPYPARSTIEVAKLPKGAAVEIECIARMQKDEEECEGGCCGGGCCGK